MLSLHPTAQSEPLTVEYVSADIDWAALNQEPWRLPPGVATPIIVAVSLALWMLIWKAGGWVATVLG